MSKLISFFLTFLAVQVALAKPNVHASSDELSLAANLEASLAPLARGFDSDSFVSVSVRKKQDDSKEDRASPFALQRQKGSSNDTNPSFVDVTIFLKRQEQGAKIRALVEDVLNEKGIQFSLKVTALPANFKLSESRDLKIQPAPNNPQLEEVLKTLSNAQVKNSQAKPTSEMSRFPPEALAFFKSSPTTFKVGLEKMAASQNEMAERLSKNIVFLIEICIAFFTALFIAQFTFFHLKQKRMEALVKSFQEALVGNGGARGGAEPSRVSKREIPDAMQGAQAQAKLGAARTDSQEAIVSMLECLSQSGLVHLIMDCYWSGSDGYAHFLWKQMPGARRAQLLSQNKILRDYVAYVKASPQIDLGLEDDPFYLDPLPIEHLDNSALKTLVLENEGLFGHLSWLRQRSLPLTISERLKFNGQTASVPLESLRKKIELIPESDSRTLSRSFDFKLANEKDEFEILDFIHEIPMEFISRTPSLIWAARASGESLSRILGRISARDLAQAWSAPAKILKLLEEHLPPEKKELLSEYLQKTEPSRQSSIYQRLCSELQSEIEKGVQGAA